MIQNIMSVDLEDYFCDLPFSQWASYKSRIIKTTDILLELFTKYNVKATFFVLGYIAEKFPELIKKIQKKDHEIGSHSYSHIDLRKVSKDEVEKDLVKSFQIIEKVSGNQVLGFRAPFFSVDRTNSWVFDLLRKYLKYDSSIFPVKFLYGFPEAPRIIYRPSQENIAKNDDSESFIEIPPVTYNIFSTNLPIAGDFYFRSLPYFLIKKGIRKFNENGNPAMVYFHPKDLDYFMPKIKEYSWHYYNGKKNILKKFENFLSDFKFTTARDILGL